MYLFSKQYPLARASMRSSSKTWWKLLAEFECGERGRRCQTGWSEHFPKMDFQTQINICFATQIIRLLQTCTLTTLQPQKTTRQFFVTLIYCSGTIFLIFFSSTLLLMTFHVSRMRPAPPPRCPGTHRETKISLGRNSRRYLFCLNVAHRAELKGKHLSHWWGGKPWKHHQASPEESGLHFAKPQTRSVL